MPVQVRPSAPNGHTAFMDSTQSDLTPPTFPTLEKIITHLKTFSPKRFLLRRWLPRSSVALILFQPTATEEVKILMMSRAIRQGDPWSGHMAFPGGLQDKDDSHSFDAALREVNEEIGIPANHNLNFIGRLSGILTHSHRGYLPMVVTPFVFHLTQATEFHPNQREVAELLWIPLPFLATAKHRTSMTWKTDNSQLSLPCYYYQQKRIWGLSLAILDELLAVVANIHFEDASSRIQLRAWLPRWLLKYLM